jgi:VanZ family protein
MGSSTRRLWWLGPGAIVLMTLFIWGQSLIPAVASSAESGRFVTLLQPLLQTLGIEPELWHHVVRKAAHMTEYALLGAAWLGTMIHCKAVSWPRKVATSAAVCMAIALGDETIQLFVPGRSGQISDVWVDLTGVAIGCVLTIAVERFIAHRRKRLTKVSHREGM